MAFSYNKIGQMVGSEPGKAARLLAAAFKRCDYIHADVCAELGVDKKTLWRWRQRLVEAGYADPSAGKRGALGPRPAEV